jgi:3-keto-5-aminohexanoate cleavage enzyme
VPSIPTKPRSPPSDLVLNLAPTGMVPTRTLSAKVPLQPTEIVQDVLRCADLGITIAHLHARDENDRPTHRKEVYQSIIDGIRNQRPELILCVSCSGRAGVSLDSRSEVLTLTGDLKPDMASLTLSSLNFVGEASINAPETVATLASRMKDAGIKPELEVFDLGMANVAQYLAGRGLIEPPFYANVFLGNLATAQARFLDIGAVVGALPAGALWSLAGIGAAQIPISAMAAAAAPGMRIGLEDNLWLDPQRERLASNYDLVERLHHLASLMGRKIMRPHELRPLLGLPQRGSATPAAGIS